MTDARTVRARVVTKPRLRHRVRYAWLRFRLGKQGRRIADAVNEQVDREFLGL